MTKKNHYLDVEVIERRRIRIDIDFAGKVTAAKLLNALEEQTYNDITDEETLEYQQVISWDSGEETE